MAKQARVQKPAPPQEPDDFGTEYANEEWGGSRADEEAQQGLLPRLQLKDGQVAQVRFVGKRKEAKIHWNAHPAMKRIVCPKTENVANPCACCEYSEDTGNKTIRASWRCYILVIDRTDGVLKIWDFSVSTKQTIHSIISNRADITAANPLSNYEVRITRHGTGMDTEYEIIVAKQATPLKVGDKELIEGAPDIETLFEVDDNSEIATLFATPTATPARGSIAPPRMPGVQSGKAPKQAVAVAQPVAEEDDDTLF